MDGESALRFADSEQKKEKAAMGMNQTPMSERTHIGFFGKRNAGKSSIINAVTGQDLAVVSDVKGTTKCGHGTGPGGRVGCKRHNDRSGL